MKIIIPIIKLKELNNLSFGVMILIVFFSTTLFLVYYSGELKDIDPGMYWVIMIVLLIWVLFFGANIITGCILAEKKTRGKK